LLIILNAIDYDQSIDASGGAEQWGGRADVPE
jgi:hypothetical protein